ncbi:MAG: hypothetical protein K8J08_21980 [Thermoanaerobaculia bacterium]|nr:hypothetical protein [Thermoanaerobaculia bacterium]
MRTLLMIGWILSLASTVAADDCSMTIEGQEAATLDYQYAVQLSDPTNPEEPVLSRLICSQQSLSDEQLWDWSKFREAFHSEGNQGFYIQFQDALVVVVGAAGMEENFSSAGFPALEFDGEIGAERLVGTLETNPSPTAFDDSVNWTLSATVDLKPVAAW